MIIEMYFFLSLFLMSHVTSFIFNSRCMILHVFSIILAPFFFIFFDMLLTLMLCIITFARSWRSTAAVDTSLTQKSFDSKILLLFSLPTLKIIIPLNHLIPCMSFHAVSVLTASEPRANATTSAALILFTLSTSLSPLIHATIFISLLGLRSGGACPAASLFAPCGMIVEPLAILAQVSAP